MTTNTVQKVAPTTSCVNDVKLLQKGTVEQKSFWLALKIENLGRHSLTDFEKCACAPFFLVNRRRAQKAAENKSTLLLLARKYPCIIVLLARSLLNGA